MNLSSSEESHPHLGLPHVALIKGYLQRNGLASRFNANIANFLRWRDLKHLLSPTTIDYSDGQTFLDILKCALPCIVQLLPPNSCLVRAIRIMVKVRIMLCLEVLIEARLALLRIFIAEYERICKDISETHGKSLNFLKQHVLSHVIGCFKDKGTSRNQNTRIGEGFPQETASVKKRTARMLSISTRMETVNRSTSLYHDFNMRLREYLVEHHPKHLVCDDENIQVGISLKIRVEPRKVFYVEFQSKFDWNNRRAILRCNPLFHRSPRYDSIIYEAQSDDLAMGQLESVFRCHLPRKVTLDLAMIRPYRKSTWAARARTDCSMRKWSPGSIFIALEHVTRGALLCPIFGAPREVFYVIDCVDEDKFLRVLYRPVWRRRSRSQRGRRVVPVPASHGHGSFGR
ncbi:hypothetical protein B0H13DRAFT_1874064 [Mycena leptocephala]|nr:hypothetical protein B0H13DRAFT_1874064 [Mycena leptocephala]